MLIPNSVIEQELYEWRAKDRVNPQALLCGGLALVNPSIQKVGTKFILKIEASS